jgi:hypothetical protein
MIPFPGKFRDLSIRIHDVITVHAQRGIALFRVDAVRDG